MEQPSSPPFAVEIAKVFVGCNLSYVSGGSLEIYAAIDRFSDATQAWNSPSLMTKMATKSTTGPNETEVTGTAFTTMKTWLEFRQTNIKKIYFTLKESDETKYVIVSDFYIRVQYRYKYQIFVSMDRAYDGSIGTVTGSLSYGGAAQQINLHTSTFTFYRNEVASFNLNPTTAIGAQQYGYNNSILTGSGYSNSGISQRQYPITLSSSTFVSIFYVPGVWVTLDNQVNFLNGSSARITGSTLKASQGGQDIQTVSAGNPVLVPQDVGIDYTTLYGNSGEDLNYIYNSTAYRVKHQNWNNDLGSA
jgi:hypothetical protein